jgi:ABC-type uncharacterized transport system involved in gliding motility auxiliary subunit
VSPADSQRKVNAMNSKTLGQVLGAVGGAVLITSPVLLLFGAATTSFVIGQAIVGLILLGSYVALDPDQIGRLISGKGTFFAATAGGIGLILFATALAANYAIATKFPKTWDLTRNKIYTLSEDTQKTVKELASPLHAYAFFVPTDRQYPQAKELLDRYHELNQNNFLVELVDPDKSPALVRQFNLKKDSGPQIVLETAGKQQEKVAQLTEEALTNGIVRLTHGAAKKVYFLTGHGEADIKDTETENGYGTVVKALGEEGINCQPLSLFEQKEVPRDAGAVVIAGPTKRYLPNEVAALKAYLDQGGRLLILLEPRIDVGLDELMKSYAVEADNDEIIDPFSRMAQQNLDVAVGLQYGQADITKGFNEITLFPSARSLVALTVPDASRPLALVTSSPKAFGETDFKMLDSGRADPEGKKSGSLAIALQTTKKIAATEKDKRSDEARLVVFGDSDFANNRWSQVGPGNQDLFMNTVSWLAEATERIAIRPRSRDASHLTMTQQQMTLVQFFSIDILPVTLLAVGIAVWRVRRSK